MGEAALDVSLCVLVALYSRTRAPDVLRASAVELAACVATYGLSTLSRAWRCDLMAFNRPESVIGD